MPMQSQTELRNRHQCGAILHSKPLRFAQPTNQTKRLTLPSAHLLGLAAQHDVPLRYLLLIIVIVVVLIVAGVLVLLLPARHVPPRAVLVGVVPIVIVVIVVAVLRLLVLSLLVLVLDVVARSIVIAVLVGRPLRYGDDDGEDAGDDVRQDEGGSKDALLPFDGAEGGGGSGRGGLEGVHLGWLLEVN